MAMWDWSSSINVEALKSETPIKKPHKIRLPSNSLTINNHTFSQPFISNIYSTTNVHDYTKLNNFVYENFYLYLNEQSKQKKYLQNLKKFNLIIKSFNPKNRDIDNEIVKINLTLASIFLEENNRRFNPKPKSQKGFFCYVCKKKSKYVHWFYLYQCVKCGDECFKRRYEQRDLTGINALVVGGRIKLGYQVVLKLLRAGARVMFTTRSVELALEFYLMEPDYEKFQDRLYVYSRKFDLSDAKEGMSCLVGEINEIFGTNSLDIVVLNAAQTIWSDSSLESSIKSSKPKIYPSWDVTFGEKYNKKPDTRKRNTWNKTINETSDEEIISVINSNVIGTILITKYLIPIMRKDPKTYMIYVHAREGSFSLHKTTSHTHTNIAKAGVAMLTRCLAGNSTHRERRPAYPQIHGINPGWFSIDEYTEEVKILKGIYNPPIDDLDAASRIMSVVWREEKSFHRTWMNYKKLDKF